MIIWRRWMWCTLIYLIWAAFLLFTSAESPDIFQWIQNSQRWDVFHFQNIWKGGYLSNSVNLGAAPGFAYASGFLSNISGLSFVTSGILISALAFFIGSVMCADLLSAVTGASFYFIFVWILSMPASYFAFIAYSDAAFFGLLWCLMWLAVKNKSRLAQMSLLLITPLFRIAGFALFVWFLLGRLYVAVLLVPFIFWLGANKSVGGDWFYFQKVQKIFGMPDGNIWDGFKLSVGGFMAPPWQGPYNEWISWLQFNFLPLLLICLLCVAAVWFWKKKQTLIAVTIVSILLVSHNQAFWRSVVRYDLPLYPCIGAMIASSGKYLKARTVLLFILMIAGFYLQFVFSRMFHAGAWGF